jgi:hypothetical protein
MNVAEPVAPLDDSGAVNDTNPWLGLVSLTEDTRGYFYGRDEKSSSCRAGYSASG